MTIRKGRREGGFTMIELIIVIVILGILAAVAIPRFLNLSTQAAISTARGVSAAIRGAVVVVHSNALINNLTTYTGGDVVAQVDLQGVTFATAGANITATIGGSTFTWTVGNPSAGLATMATLTGTSTPDAGVFW